MKKEILTDRGLPRCLKCKCRIEYTIGNDCPQCLRNDAKKSAKGETIVAVREGAGAAVTLFAFPTAAKARSFAKAAKKQGWEIIVGYPLPKNGEIIKMAGKVAAGMLLALVMACGTQAPADQTTALVAQKAATQETTTAPTATDGAAGAPAIIQQADVAPGPECKAGGVRFMSWTDYAPDAAKDGTPTFTPGIDQGFASRVVCAGADGQDGKDGVGLPGKDGSAGAQGVAGANGASGTDGEDGAGLPTFQVVDGSGALVGSLAWVNPANSDYWVVKGDLRMQFSRTVGHFPYAYTFCSAADCTGTCKLAITNGFFANTFAVYETGAAVRAVGRAQAASFAYASRRMGSSCANTPGSTTGLFDMAFLSQADLGFAYPITGAEALNTVGITP